MARRITFMRHGICEGDACYRGITDDVLSVEGQLQMHDAIHHLGPWDIIISSPLKRCAEFGRRISLQQRIDFCLDRRFMELNFGAWEGKTAAQIMQTAPAALEQFWQNPECSPPPGGETLASLRARVLAAWNELLVLNHRNILVITHGGPIRTILAEVLGASDQQMLAFRVPYASLHHFEVKHDCDDQPYACLINDIADAAIA